MGRPKKRIDNSDDKHLLAALHASDVDNEFMASRLKELCESDNDRVKMEAWRIVWGLGKAPPATDTEQEQEPDVPEDPDDPVTKLLDRVKHGAMA